MYPRTAKYFRASLSWLADLPEYPGAEGIDVQEFHTEIGRIEFIRVFNATLVAAGRAQHVIPIAAIQ